MDRAYGLAERIDSSAFFILAAATNIMALVICLMFLIDLIFRLTLLTLSMVVFYSLFIGYQDKSPEKK